MGRRGPAAKPDQLKQLQGNPGHRPLNTSAPKFPKYDTEEKLPKPPSHLMGPAKREWKRLIPVLHKAGVLTQVDLGALEAYCQSYGMYVEASKLIKAHGFTDTTDKGNVIQRPEVGTANTAMKNMVSFAAQFGMTPSARTNVKIEEVENNETPFAVFLGGKRSG